MMLGYTTEDILQKQQEKWKKLDFIYNFKSLNKNLKKYYMHYYKLFQKYKCSIENILIDIWRKTNDQEA